MDLLILQPLLLLIRAGIEVSRKLSAQKKEEAQRSAVCPPS